MFQVFDSGRPADCMNHNVHPSWKNSKFETLEEAQEYVKIWVGGDYDADHPLALNEEYDYSGYGDVVKIVESK